MRVNAAVREEEIAAFIRRYYLQHDRLPSEKDIVAGTGIPAGSVHRCLIRLREKGEFSREGGRRGAKPEDLDHVSPKRILRVLGTVACGAIERDAIHKLLNIKNGRALLAHPVGLPMQ